MTWREACVEVDKRHDLICGEPSIEVLSKERMALFFGGLDVDTVDIMEHLHRDVQSMVMSAIAQGVPFPAIFPGIAARMVLLGILIGQDSAIKHAEWRMA